jgi:small subunit ribosomal protein S4
VSRRQARQLVRHGHIEVNGRRVNVPSYRAQPGQEIRVATSSRELVPIKVAREFSLRGAPMAWLDVNLEKGAGKFTEAPGREQIPLNAQEQLIVELYSK